MKIKRVKQTELRNVEIVIMKEGDFFVPWVPSLQLTSSARTLEQAQKNIVEAISLFFEGCTEMGTLDLALQECGWTKVKRNHKTHLEPPRIVANLNAQIPVPV